VILSGSTVALGLVSMVALALALIRSIGIGGMLIPAVSVLAGLGTQLNPSEAQLNSQAASARFRRGRGVPLIAVSDKRPVSSRVVEHEQAMVG
jgi:hypothetical protein